MAYSTDPVGNGLVASLVHPSGNITGLAGSSDDSSPKQLELLTTIVPNVSRVGLLGNPDTETYASVLNNAQDAARKAGLSLVPIEARNRQEIEDAFAAFAKERVPAPDRPDFHRGLDFARRFARKGRGRCVGRSAGRLRASSQMWKGGSYPSPRGGAMTPLKS
jgi:hypothetical protein